jgi:myosin heavy subunit
VKTLTAGQNLINNQTSVKTRKQPLTVTAQFQNSLIALMETLNQVFSIVVDSLISSIPNAMLIFQANPFFIRCIKSNPNKIPNQFDDATVTRQVRKRNAMRNMKPKCSFMIIIIILGSVKDFLEIYMIALQG